MEKIDLTKQFALRLKDAMIAAGFDSGRSRTGVDVAKLAELTGHSTQICRKYLRGEAIPEPTKLMEIAEKLQVSPGWLLFGDAQSHSPHSQSHLIISKKNLRYIFKQMKSLYNSPLEEEGIADFLLDMLDDLSQINATEAQSQRIVDLALSSIHRLRRK